VLRGVSDATTTIVCPPGVLLAAFGGLSEGGYERRGAADPLAWAQLRVKLAQSG
jgi:hypothetical protein